MWISINILYSVSRKPFLELFILELEMFSAH